MDGDTQLMDDYPGDYPSGESSDTEESSGSDNHSHQPTQLLYTQLIDQYDGDMDDPARTKDLEDMDIQTQLIAEHSFDDYGDHEGVREQCRMLIPSEDEASKEYRMVNDNDQSGLSSGKDNEAESAMGARSRALNKTPSWFSLLAGRSRAESVPYRSTFSSAEEYLRQAPGPPNNHNEETQFEMDKNLTTFAKIRAGPGRYSELQGREAFVPQYCRESDLNKQDRASQRIMDVWHDVGLSNRCNEDDTVWAGVRGITLVDSDASTEDEDQDCHFNTGGGYPVEGQLSQNVNLRVLTHTSNNICQQDLNKSPEPEFFPMDDWRENNGEDLGVIERIDEGGSNVGLLDRHGVVNASQSTPIENGNKDGFNGSATPGSSLAPSTSRTSGSIRTASLRASALRVTSLSSERYSHTPRESQREEQKVEHQAKIEMPSDLPQQTGSSMGHSTPTSRPCIAKGIILSAASQASGWSNTDKEWDHSRSSEEVCLTEKATEKSTRGPEVDTDGQMGMSVLDLEGPKYGGKSASRVRKLFSEDDVEEENHHNQVKVERVQSWQHLGKDDEEKSEVMEILPPTLKDSSPAQRTLERRSSFGSGFFSTGSDLSYLNLQSPGEDSQARALNMVDKLVWLNAIGLPQDLKLEDEEAPARGPHSSKSALQSRVQVAEAKAGMSDPLGVFDWVDSQQDEPNVFFRSSKASTFKGSLKPSGSAGHLKQSSAAQKKGSNLDVTGNRNRRVERLPEKCNKTFPNLDKQKIVACKNASPVKENRIAQKYGSPRRDQSCTGITGNLQSRESISAAPNSEKRIENKGLQEDKCPENVEAMNNVHTADKFIQVLTSIVPQEEENRSSPDGSGFEVLQKVSSLPVTNEEKVHETLQVQRGSWNNTVMEQLDKLGKTPRDMEASDQSLFCPKLSPKGKGLGGRRSPPGNAQHVQEINTLDRMEESECKAGPMAELSHTECRENVRQEREGEHEGKPNQQVAFIVKEVNLEQEDGGVGVLSRESLTAAAGQFPSRNPSNGDHQGILGRDQAYDTVQQQRSKNTAKDGSPLEQATLSLRPQLHVQDQKRLQVIADFDVLQENGSTSCEMDGCLQDVGKSSSMHLLPGRVMEENLEVMPKHFNEMGFDTQVAVETMGLLKMKASAEIGDGVDGKDGNQYTACTSGQSCSKDMADGKSIVEEEMCDVSKRVQLITRRSRSQGRHGARVENPDAPSGSRFPAVQEKTRGRRVSWAGPLERVPRKDVEVRKSCRFRVDNDGRGEDGTDDAKDASGQDDPGVMRGATGMNIGKRKRKTEASDIGGSGDSDVDKMKRRPNMSHAAVSRRLGIDEDEEAEVNDTAGVKIRSLSHMQPGGEEDPVGTAPKIRSAGKGLRSSRSRTEDGTTNGRKRRAFAAFNEEAKGMEDEKVTFSLDRNETETGSGGTTCVEMQPSDNEVIPGRRRMRSIADVSSPCIKKTTTGRPQQVTALRRSRGRHLVGPPLEPREVPSDAEEREISVSSIMPPFSPISRRVRGKGGPRSVRKRKEVQPLTTELSASPTSSKDVSTMVSKRSRRDPETTCVLLSHGLADDTVKQQRKIVAKLGGRVAASAAECTHFVAEKFVRTGNMLEAMAAGKPVVTVSWLEFCLEAKYFVDDQAYILEDTMKEEEMGFSMTATLAAAQQRPLLQGIRVYIMPGTSPGPEALARIVMAAGGQVVDEYVGPAPDGVQDSGFCLVIASEDELDECIPLLEQGAKIFTPELVLSGVMCHNLDFSNDQLFQTFTSRRRRASLSRRTSV